MKYLAGRISRQIPDTVQHKLVQYANITKQKHMVDVAESHWIEFQPGEQNVPNLGVEDFYNCVCVHFHAQCNKTNTIKAGLVHFNTLENSHEVLEEAVDKFRPLQKEGHSTSVQIITNLSVDGMARDMQSVARAHVHSALGDIPAKSIFTSDNNFTIPSQEAPPQIGNDLVTQSWAKDLLAQGIQIKGQEHNLGSSR